MSAMFAKPEALRISPRDDLPGWESKKAGPVPHPTTPVSISYMDSNNDSRTLFLTLVKWPIYQLHSEIPSPTIET